MTGRVLVIAGSDSGGGAGVEADIKTITALGAYASTAITALTAQNTLGVHGVHPVPPPFVRQLIRVVLDDIGADVVKIGMLGTAALIEAVAGELATFDGPIVVDPVMVAKGGARLLDPAAIGAFIAHILPRATLLTPNVPEAEALTSLTITDDASYERAMTALLRMGAIAVLMKGGHRPGGTVVDILGTAEGVERLERPRINTKHTHGTGCTYASAIAAGLSDGMLLSPAVHRARSYVQAAIEAAPGFGAGHGPLWHGHPIPAWEAH